MTGIVYRPPRSAPHGSLTWRAIGPLYDGRMEQVLAEFIPGVRNEVAHVGIGLVHHELDRVIRDPTPYYETRIAIDYNPPGRRDSTRVWDNKVIYGPWLEGTGSRNKTTRFKGYSTFRRMRDTLARQAPAIAMRYLQRFIGRMG